METVNEASEAFVSYKEKAEYRLVVKLREEGKITTPSKPFERSDIAEIDVLLTRGVIRLIKYNPNSKYYSICLFKSRLV